MTEDRDTTAADPGKPGLGSPKRPIKQNREAQQKAAKQSSQALAASQQIILSQGLTLIVSPGKKWTQCMIQRGTGGLWRVGLWLVCCKTS